MDDGPLERAAQLLRKAAAELDKQRPKVELVMALVETAKEMRLLTAHRERVTANNRQQGDAPSPVETR